MISVEGLYSVGHVQKVCGVEGGLMLLFDNSCFADINVDLYFLKVDGIVVPFFIQEAVRIDDMRIRVKFEGIDSKEAAARYVNLPVLIDRSLVDGVLKKSDDHFAKFDGYNVYDDKGRGLGVISEIDDSTLNVLFVVERYGKKFLIPATDDFIVSRDDTVRKIVMRLPEGLIESQMW